VIKKLKKLYFLWWYGRHLKKRIDKNNSGRREERE